MSVYDQGRSVATIEPVSGADLIVCEPGGVYCEEDVFDDVLDGPSGEDGCRFGYNPRGRARIVRHDDRHLCGDAFGSGGAEMGKRDLIEEDVDGLEGRDQLYARRGLHPAG